VRLNTPLDTIADETSTIISPDFNIATTTTNNIPQVDDSAITHANLDSKTQQCKKIETAVLYVDLRDYSPRNLANRAPTMAKLYSAFIGAMILPVYNDTFLRRIIDLLD